MGIQKDELLHERTEKQKNKQHEWDLIAIETEREILGLIPVISDVVLKGLKGLAAEHFKKYTALLFPVLCDLTIVNSREVRQMVREVLLSQITLMGTSAPINCL